MWRGVLVMVLAIQFACSSLPKSDERDLRDSQEDLLAGAPILLGAQMPGLPEVDVLAMTPEMHSFLAQAVNPRLSPSIKLKRLLRRFIDDKSFRIDYSQMTYTAGETFSSRRGNCLSFTNMFIAMARQLGVDAHYQQVNVPPSWDQRGNFILLSRHINIHIKAPKRPGGTSPDSYVVDFNARNYKSIYRTEILSDERALAHYHSNIGVQKLSDGEYLQSFLNFRRGLELDPDFEDLWNNLGALYSRIGKPDYAEKSYLIAARKGESMAALSNLTHLYERIGNDEQASIYRQQVARFRARNPYYRYHLAQDSLNVGDLKAAAEHLRYAMRIKPEEDSFYYLMGMVVLKTGDQSKALKYFEEARQVAADDTIKRRYSDKIRQLLGDEAGS